MALTPFTERHHRQFSQKGDGLTPSRSGDRSPSTLIQRIPQTLRLAIEDQKDVLKHVSADAELVDLTVLLAAVHDGPLRQWSPARGNALAANLIIHKLMVIQQPDWVRSGLAVADVTHHDNVIVGFRSWIPAVPTGRQFQQPGVVG